MNVRAFTADESSGLDSTSRGSYLGLIDKVSTIFCLFMNTTICLYLEDFPITFLNFLFLSSSLVTLSTLRG